MELIIGFSFTVPRPEPVLAPTPRPPARGESYGEVILPRLGERETILVGTRVRELDRGVGHMTGTAWPGQTGMVGLWAHRVTPVNGRSVGPFRYIDRLRRGDRVIVRMPYGRAIYRVTRHDVIANDDWSMVARARLGPRRVTLSACHPPGSAAFRYVVTARQTRMVTRKIRP